ncbi:MAG: hypothetical protein ACLUDU_11265 [Butyricimonas faecihominis]
MRGLFLIFTIFFFTTFTPLVAQEEMTRLRYGKLANGMTYYVKHSNAQPGRVSFYLLQNVGQFWKKIMRTGWRIFWSIWPLTGQLIFREV